MKLTASALDSVQGICLYNKLKPLLLIATPVNGSFESVLTLIKNGLELETTGPARRLPNLCPQYLSAAY